MCRDNCSKRGKGGAAILLISEDLDELMSLTDKMAVMSNGKLSAGF